MKRRRPGHLYAPAILMLMLASVLSAASLTTLASTNTSIPLTSLVDPCALTFENALSYEVVTLPSGLRVKAITIYNMPEGYVVTLITESPDVKVDVQGTTSGTTVNQPVFCIMSVDIMYEARIGLLIPPFTLRITIDGEEYLVTRNQAAPSYAVGQAIVASSLETTVTKLTQTQTTIEKEEEYGNEIEEKELEAEEVQEVHEETAEKAGGLAEEKGEAKELPIAGLEKEVEAKEGNYLMQSLPLAVGTVTFILAYLVSRRIL